MLNTNDSDENTAPHNNFGTKGSKKIRHAEEAKELAEFLSTRLVSEGCGLKKICDTHVAKHPDVPGRFLLLNPLDEQTLRLKILTKRGLSFQHVEEGIENTQSLHAACTEQTFQLDALTARKVSRFISEWFLE